MGFRTYGGNRLSENGWRICDTAEIVKPLVPGTNNVRPEVRGGVPATILVAVAARYHQLVWPIDAFQPRDYWGFSWENVVPNSNHLAGTAVDLTATRLPWKVDASANMPPDKIAACRQILDEFRGCVFWGNDWDTRDPMHWQLNLPEGDPQLDDLAADLEGGYLGVYAPPDPDAFPLPGGWYYGPLDGPRESISGLFETDPQPWKDGLKRWQGQVGIPQTGIWDEATAERCRTMQVAKGWPLSGWLYQGEWDVVIRENFVIPAGTEPPPTIFQPPVTETRGARWADVSHYQRIPIDDSYPHRVFCFRTNSGDKIDTLAVENGRRAKAMLEAGKLDLVLPYYFFWPGQQNCDLHKQLLMEADLWLQRGTASMIDVEDANHQISGDQSDEVNDEFGRLAGWYGSRGRVFGYWNPVSNRDLWLTRPAGIRLVIPSYGRTPGEPMLKPDGYFAHQYSDAEPCPPWGRCDGNFADMTMSELKAMFA